MNIRILSTTADFAAYNRWVRTLPQGSLWQSLEWKKYQEALGREVRIYVAGEGILASALVVIDRTTGGWSTWDIPRGPLLVPRSSFLVDAFLTQIVLDARQQRCLGVYLSPTQDIPTMHGQRSTRNEQPEATRMIDLTPSEDDILAQMHPKGRYNIRVAQKNGVRVEQADDVEAFYGLLRQTAVRDGFEILPLKAYKTFLELLPGSFLLLAYDGQRAAIAGLMGAIWPPAPHPGPCLPAGRLSARGEGRIGIYYYGASSYAHRPLMAPYALQWEAMRLCKGKGCSMYDLLGVVVPDPLSLTLPPRGRELFHPWAGVSAFKEKFGGAVVTYPPEQQIVLRPVLWKALQWKRWIAG